MSKRKAADRYPADLDDEPAYAIPTPSKKPRGKNKATQDDVEGGEQVIPEIRLARIKKSCPKNITERVYRVMTQRFFMVDRRREGEELREEFKVLGSTGNVYNVVIDRLPACNCPDAAKGNHCKHILFVFLKVLGVPRDSSLYYQKALLTSELQSIFDAAPKNPSSIASTRIRELYAQATGAAPPPKDEAGSSKKKKKLEDGDECPICYESMGTTPEATLEFCQVCSNALHKECFGQWRTTNRGKPITCVWCRSPWIEEEEEGVAGSSKAMISEDGYLNLGGAAGVSPERDTSTYYYGPRKGQSAYYSGRRYY